MKVVGFCGASGSGKTTLIERLLPLLKAKGLRVSVLKHAHHAFDIDHVGKDSWRHRQAGAFEVVIASNHRLAKIREFEAEREFNVHHMLAELSACDWALVEGFKHAHLPKIEVWRASAHQPAQYPQDLHVVAVATDDVNALPQPTNLPVLDLNRAFDVAQFLLTPDEHRYDYTPPALAQLE
jgi:molybdopterin-guanine dinucleotide biosynthesis adapter protein